MSPRLTPEQAVVRVSEAIARAEAAIDAATDARKYDEAWQAADTLAGILQGGRGRAARHRARVLVQYAQDDRRSLAEAGRRFGVNRARAAQLAQLAAEEGYGDAVHLSQPPANDG